MKHQLIVLNGVYLKIILQKVLHCLMMYVLKKIGGPGQPDTLCHYITGDLNFVADGKSTSKKIRD